MALKIFRAPLRYVQGLDALLQMGEQLKILGIENPLILASSSARKAVEPAMVKALKGEGINYAFIDFGGASTWKEINRVKNACILGGHDAIISCGGGRVLDTGRCAAAGDATNVMKSPPEFFPRFGAGVPCINVPTVASTDASTGAASIVHTEKGAVEATMVFPSNPAMVVVDTAVIAKSPVRLLVAGMGDALATYFEADMSNRTSSPSIGNRALSTRAAQALARLCFNLLMDHGVQAMAEVERGIPGPGIEAIAEANVLLSGLGVQNGGLSVAHAVGNAFENIPESFEKPLYHGELVAFGTLTQLVLEGRNPKYLDKIYGFCEAVGLPTTFDQMTVKTVTDDALETVASVASRDNLIQSMSGATRERDKDGRFYGHREILNALKAADAYGRTFAGRHFL